MLRVLICGEGKHEIGTRPAYGAAGEEGWLQPILRKLIGKEIDVVWIKRQQLVLLPREAKSLQPLPKGHGAKALAIKIRGNAESYDIVVFMVDADSKEVKEWRRKREEIVDGFSRVPGVGGAPCVPKSTSESWLLADEEAWRQVGLVESSKLPSKPETIWGGRNDHEGDHPHQFFRRICEEAQVADSRETRFRLAVYARTETIQQQCPVSFATFVDDLRMALA